MDRFWSKVDKSGECWEWQAARDKNGYGRFRSTVAGTRAHRHSFYLAHGIIPDGLQVLHRCDNPPCVNPAHLWLGTPRDNAIDRNAKGRHDPQIGGTNGNARLTEAEIPRIRDMIASGGSNQEIGEVFGVSPGMIWNIRTGRNWSHV